MIRPGRAAHRVTYISVAALLMAAPACTSVEAPFLTQPTEVALHIGFGLTTGQSLDAGMRETARGIAVEGLMIPANDGRPQPRLADLIRRSLAEAPAPFEVHDVALGDREGDTLLHVPRGGSGAASIAARSPGQGRSFIVPVRRADALLAGRQFPGSLVLKLDVEGSELSFLRGARALIEERRPVILFELSAVQARAAGHEPQDLLAELGKLGYRRWAEVDRYPDEILGSVGDLERQRNLVAIP